MNFFILNIHKPTSLLGLGIKPLHPGPNLDFLCIWQSDTAPFCENYAKLYFNTNHLEKGLKSGW